jgi:hypothetical protein
MPRIHQRKARMTHRPAHGPLYRVYLEGVWIMTRAALNKDGRWLQGERSGP